MFARNAPHKTTGKNRKPYIRHSETIAALAGQNTATSADKRASKIPPIANTKNKRNEAKNNLPLRMARNGIKNTLLQLDNPQNNRKIQAKVVLKRLTAGYQNALKHSILIKL
jgi:hypothetical protein